MWENPDLEDIPDYEEMEEVAEPRGPHADFYDMRATPPSFRMSAGTRSSAMTATAPASSAMRA